MAAGSELPGGCLYSGKKKTAFASGQVKLMMHLQGAARLQVVLYYAVAGLAFLVRGGFITFPAFRHEVQTFIRFGTPFTSARTVCRFGFHRRLVRLWAWETLFPKVGFLPHISHTFAILGLDSFLAVFFHQTNLYTIFFRKRQEISEVGKECGGAPVSLGRLQKHVNLHLEKSRPAVSFRQAGAPVRQPVRQTV